MQGIGKQVTDAIAGAVVKAVDTITGNGIVEIPTTNTHVMVMRVPDERGKHHYSKRVTVQKADRLINGKTMINRETGERVRVPLKRKYILVGA